LPIPGKSITIGNLSVGGTGKSPLTEYLIAFFLESDVSVTTLSRGYGRKTKGFRWVDQNTTTDEVGDEPLMFKTVCGADFPVAVCENRNAGVEKIQNDFKKTDLIVLDDAFQHRKISAGFSILLTTHEKPFFNDAILPMGTLREFRRGAARANVIVVTKCPKKLNHIEKKVFLEKLIKYNKPIFFSKVKYGELLNFTISVEKIKNVLVVSGIANPADMIEHLSNSYLVEPILFSDHHEFTQGEINKIHRKFDTFVANESAIVTTQKDFMRLRDKIEKWGMEKYPWYVLPISIEIENEIEFNKLIFDYVGKN
jgi:tetraacyldisaccharide 4'-kinase